MVVKHCDHSNRRVDTFETCQSHGCWFIEPGYPKRHWSSAKKFFDFAKIIIFRQVGNVNCCAGWVHVFEIFGVWNFESLVVKFGVVFCEWWVLKSVIRSWVQTAHHQRISEKHFVGKILLTHLHLVWTLVDYTSLANPVIQINFFNIPIETELIE